MNYRTKLFIFGFLLFLGLVDFANGLFFSSTTAGLLLRMTLYILISFFAAFRIMRSADTSVAPLQRVLPMTFVIGYVLLLFILLALSKIF